VRTNAPTSRQREKENVPWWDKRCQAASAEKVDEQVPRTSSGALVLVQRVELCTNAGEKENQALAKHPGDAEVHDLQGVGKGKKSTEHNVGHARMKGGKVE